jgi:short-subunit dehydrogenase
MLVNCAGMAICGRLEDTSVEDIKVGIDFQLGNII